MRRNLTITHYKNISIQLTSNISGFLHEQPFSGQALEFDLVIIFIQYTYSIFIPILETVPLFIYHCDPDKDKAVTERESVRFYVSIKDLCWHIKCFLCNIFVCECVQHLHYGEHPDMGASQHG